VAAVAAQEIFMKNFDNIQITETDINKNNMMMNMMMRGMMVPYASVLCFCRT